MLPCQISSKSSLHNTSKQNMLPLLSGPRVCEIVVRLLQRKCHHEELGNPQNIYPMPSFFNKTIPAMSLSDYAQRLLYYTRREISPSCLIVALLLVEKVTENELCPLTDFTMHRLLSTGLLLAHKVVDDAPHTDNKSYSEIAGIPLRELNSLEIEMLRALNWDLRFDFNSFVNTVYDTEYVCIHPYNQHSHGKDHSLFKKIQYTEIVS
eukprot:gene7035-14305_t